jgi:PKD repeat protein
MNYPFQYSVRNRERHGVKVFTFLLLFCFLISPVTAAADPPIANFSATPTSGDRPLDVNFTDTSTGTVTIWLWTFGDGDTSLVENPSHTYNDTGWFDVKLTVSGVEGNDDTTMVALIHVTEPPPVANFSGTPTSGDKPLDVDFTDTSTGGAITSWSWTFGDGGTSFLQHPSHTYTDTGNFDVTLTVTGPGGSDPETKSNYIRVDEPPPVAAFYGTPTSGNKPLDIQFVDQSTGGAITSWSWEFGDDSTSTLKNPLHTYTEEGVYSVTLTVTGPGGSDDTTRVNYITVSEEVSANFGGTPRSGVVPLTVNFTDSSTGSIDDWDWAFGDGGTSDLQDPSHQYTTSGDFDVRLTVDGPGGTDDEIKFNYITVYDSLIADFTASPDSGSKPLEVQFTDLSSGDITSWKWLFGDGEQGFTQHPSHIYPDSGHYDVTLVITGPAGADTIVKTNYITVTEPAPVANFWGNPISGQAPLTVNFEDLSTGSITSWYWRFGDTETSYEQNPSHQYTQAGMYNVRLDVTGPGGADDTTRVNYITVNPGDPDTIIVTGIDNPMQAGELSDVTVEIRDAYNNRVENYSGTVHFDTNDPGSVTLPSDYIFNPPGDPGFHTFNNGVALVTEGSWYVEVNDVLDPMTKGRQSGIDVQPNDPGILVLTPADTVNITVGASTVFTASVTDDYNNPISGIQIEILLKGTVNGALSRNLADPNPTWGTGSQRWGNSDSEGKITVLYTAPSEADLYDVLDSRAQPYINYSQVDDVVIRSVASGATKFVILPSGPIVEDVNDPFDITIEAQDSNDNRDPTNSSTALLGSTSPTMEFSVNGFMSTITQITLSNGRTTNLQARDQTTGNPTVEATDQAGILTKATKSNITINPGPADHLSLTGMPGTVTAGDARTVDLEVLDEFENRVTDYLGTVRFTTNDSGSQVSLPSNHAFTSGDSGFHTFDDGVTLVTVGSWYLRVNDISQPTVYDNIPGINVVHANADSFDISGIPGTIEAGQQTPFTVTVYDPYENVVTSYTSTVRFQTDDPGSEVVLPGNYKFQSSDEGVRYFETPGMTLVTAGTWELEALEVGNPSVRGSFGGINVTHTSLDTFILTGLPGSTTVGEYHSLQVEAQDRYSNKVLNYDGTVQFTSSDPQADLPSTYTFDGGDQGYHNFPSSVAFLTAGFQTVTATDPAASVSGISEGTNVTFGAPHSIVITPPDTVYVTVDAGQVFTATVRDSFQNPVPGIQVTMFISDGLDGVLDDNPDDPNNTQGEDQWQRGTTDPDGKITVLYNAPSQSGLYDILDASSATIPAGQVEDVVIQTVASGATKLIILPTTPIEAAANDPFSLIVEAQDSNDNRDFNDSTWVSVASDSETMEFSTNNFQTMLTRVRLVNGRSQNLAARDTTAGTPTFTVEDIDSLGIRLAPDTKSNITIVASDPFGDIQLSFSGRDTLTANGSSTTSIFSQAIVDSFSNNVGYGVLITISADLGTITPDVSPLPGVQVRTDSLGTITFNYRAGSVAGIDTLRAVSVEGNAAGSIVLVLQSEPVLAYVQETLNPNTVSPETVHEFELVLTNNGEAGVTLDTTTTFNFGTGLTEFSSFLSGAYFIEGNGGQATILFLPDTIPADMPEGAYTPTLDVDGIDSNESSYDSTVVVSDSSRLHVSSLILNSVAVFADTVSHGDSVEVLIEVRNLGGTQVALLEAGLNFDPSEGQFTEAFRNLPLVIPPGGTRNVEGSFRVGSITPPGTYMVDAFVSGSTPGGAVSDSSANVGDSFVVISAALASYVEDSIEPDAISAGGTYSFRLDLINMGDSDVDLYAGTTHLVVGEEGALADVSIPELKQMRGDSAVTTLTFDSDSIPASTEPGLYPITLYLDGTTGHGGVFQQIIELPDSILIEIPPEIEYISLVSTDTISAGQQHAFSTEVDNNGESSLDLNIEMTRFYFEGSETSFESSLNSQGASTIDPGTVTTLTFDLAMVPGSLASGVYQSYIALQGLYNGVSFTDTLEASSLTVERAATLRMEVISAQDNASQGETFSVSARVINEGEADIVNSGLLLLTTDNLLVENPELDFGPDLPDTVTWQVSVPSDLNPDIEQLTASISQLPLDKNSGLSANVSAGEETFALSVVEKNRLSFERVDVGGVPPQNVFKGQQSVPMLQVQVRSLGANEGDIRLNEIEVGLEQHDGIQINSPGNVLDSLYLVSSSSGGEILAGASSPEQNRFTLSLNGDYLVSSDPDTLLFYVNVSLGVSVQTFRLVIDGEDAIDADDISTETTASVVEGSSGIPLGVFRSQFTVLNLRSFETSFKNYPNPMGSGDGSTTFSYYLPEDSDVTIMIYTLTGQLVKKQTFQSGQNGGRGSEVNQVQWGGYNGVGKYVNNGVYVCIATARTRSGTVFSTKYKLAVMR